MNTATKILAAAAFSALAMVGAQAESYDGVHAPTNGAARAEVHADAVQTAHGPNIYGDSYGEGVTSIASTGGRADVRQQAVAAAHGPNVYGDTYGEGVTKVGGQVDRATVRAAARAAAHGDQLPL